MAVAGFLAGHERVSEGFYLGRTSHQHHELASRQMRGHGGMLSFSLHGGHGAAKTFLTKL